MTKKRQNRNHGTGYPAGIKIMISESGNTFCYHMHFCHGASAISERKKRFKSVEDALLFIISIITLTGFKPLSFAVRIMVMMIETLRFPRFVILPKVIFLNKTAFLIPCSAGLLVGGTAVYSRKVKSSSLNFIKRLRMLSLSWCLSSECLRSFLNLFRIFFLAERYSVSERAGCTL